MDLKQARQRLGLSCEELGRRVGVKARTIGAYERGERMPKIEVCAKLAKELRVPIEDVFAAVTSKSARSGKAIK